LHELPRLSLGPSNARPHPPREGGVWHGPYTWDAWVIDWMAEGENQFELIHRDGRREPFVRSAHTWQIYPAGIGYRHLHDKDHGPVMGLWFFFDPEVPIPELDPDRCPLIFDPLERLVPHVQEIYAQQQSGARGSAAIALAHATTVLTEIIAAAQRGQTGAWNDPWVIRAPAKPGGEVEGLLAQVDQAVLEQLPSAPTLDEIAADLGMSVSALAHRFKAETRQSVMQRVRWLRIREAQRLLEEPGASVKAVARKLRFSSPFHFSKLFRELTGVTPRDFLRRIRS